jgi:cell division septation protein DedD
MAGERKQGEAVREFRLEGLGLLLVGGLLIVLLGGAFYLGRWYERQTGPGPSAAAGGALAADPLANISEAAPAADVDQAADFFDEVEGGQKEVEPGREARSEQATPVEPPAAEPRTAERPAATPAGGPFYVQVFAGRDREAAEGLVRKLTGGGYQVRLFSEREGRGALYKVRVGGYPSREGARAAANRLEREGYSGAWVTEVR